jgi:3-oxoacyl-[acyl-carrier protein] reductase
MNLDLNGRIALVTGGARGIGRECCLKLARAGATVIINFHRSENEAECLKRDICDGGFRAEAFRADITHSIDLQGLFNFIRETFGRLDILVNNAGIIMDRLLLGMKATEWDRVQDVNLKGAFLTSQRAVELMLPHHRGKIINIASTSGIRGGRGQTNYAAAKGGLIAFTRACAVELAGKNIQVNAVLPGLIETQMSDRVRKRAGKEILQKIPASRFGKASDVADLVVFLASDKSDYITGQAIAVDGGLSIS